MNNRIELSACDIRDPIFNSQSKTISYVFRFQILNVRKKKRHSTEIDTLAEWIEVVKCFTPECGGKTPRGLAPRCFPDARGGNTFTTEQEQGVMSLLSRPPLGVVDHYSEQ